MHAGPTLELGSEVQRLDGGGVLELTPCVAGQHPHDLELVAVGVGTAAAQKVHGGIGLYHLAWQLDTIEELAEARQALIDIGAYTGESSHGATKSVYGVDPDRNEFEVMWMLPRDAWGEFENAAPVERLHLAAELERWSGVRTAGRIVTDTDVATS